MVVLGPLLTQQRAQLGERPRLLGEQRPSFLGHRFEVCAREPLSEGALLRPREDGLHERPQCQASRGVREVDRAAQERGARDRAVEQQSFDLDRLEALDA